MSSIERHYDFVRIRNEFIKYYGASGEEEYYFWLHALKLNENKPYGLSQERFSFIKDQIQKLKEDIKNVYYKVLVGFPLTSMNGNLYTQDKLSAAAGTLINSFNLNLNHYPSLELPGVQYVAAKFEDGAVEAVLKVPKDTLVNLDLERKVYEVGRGKPLFSYIDEGVIINQSLEAESNPEFHFTGSALLTKDTLPGIPLSRIMPLETVVSEALSASQMLKAKPRKLQIVGLGKEKEMSANGQNLPAQQDGDQQKGKNSIEGAVVSKNGDKPVEGSAEYISQLKVEKLQAEKHSKDLELQLEALNKGAALESEAKVKGFELALETAKNELLKESTARQKADGRIVELEARNSKLERASTEYVNDKIADGDTIKKFQRIVQDKSEELETSRKPMRSLPSSTRSLMKNTVKPCRLIWI